MPRLMRIWLLWFGVVLFLSLPWMGFTPFPQWQRVHWVPFEDPANKLRDVILNGLLFVPLGFAVSRRRSFANAVMLSAAMALSMSLLAEATQLFSSRRFPSATDVVVAVIGAVAGAAATVSMREATRPRTWTD